jgi:hypothetical protein
MKILVLGKSSSGAYLGISSRGDYYFFTIDKPWVHDDIGIEHLLAVSLAPGDAVHVNAASPARSIPAHNLTTGEELYITARLGDQWPCTRETGLELLQSLGTPQKWWLASVLSVSQG